MGCGFESRGFRLKTTIYYLIIPMSVAVVIHSCDLHSIMWDGWWHYFKKYFDFDAPVYFMNESLDINFEGVQQIKLGSFAANHWSNAVKSGLEQITENDIFFLQEDMWPILTPNLREHYLCFKSFDMNGLKIQQDDISNDLIDVKKDEHPIIIATKISTSK